MSDGENVRLQQIIRELTERVNRLSGQVAALSACVAVTSDLEATQSRRICGMARDMAAKKIGDPSIRTEPSDIAARQVVLIVETSQAGVHIFDPQPA